MARPKFIKVTPHRLDVHSHYPDSLYINANQIVDITRDEDESYTIISALNGHNYCVVEDIETVLIRIEA